MEIRPCSNKPGMKMSKNKRKIVPDNPTLLSATGKSDQIQEQGLDKNHDSLQVVEETPNAVSLNPTTINTTKVFFVLDKASLGKIRFSKTWRVAHSVDDAALLKMHKKNVDDFRSDLLHEALKAIIDSPLCKYGGVVGGIFVKIQDGVLFQVNPHVRIPRTLPRFCGVMSDLLDKSSVSAKGTGEKLFQVIEEPVTRHLPPDSHIIGISADSTKIVDIEDYVSAANHYHNLVFMVGAGPNGKISEKYVDDQISVSYYPLLPRGHIELVCNALENQWNIF